MNTSTPRLTRPVSRVWPRCLLPAYLALTAAGCGSSNFFDGTYRPTYTPEEREAVRAAVAEGSEAIRDAAAAARAEDTTATGRGEPPRASPPRVTQPAPAPGPAPAPPPEQPPAQQPPGSTGSEPLSRVPGTPTTLPGPTRIMAYKTSDAAGAVNFFVNDLVQGGLIHVLDPGQRCGAPGAITLTVRPGYHKLYAEAAGRRASWGPVTREVREGECYIWRLGAPVQQGPSSEGRRDDTRSQTVMIAFWTRRSLNIDRLDVFVDGRLISPAPWSFSRDPDDCGRMPAYAVKDYTVGSSVLIEVRKAKSADWNAPLVFSSRLTAPAQTCYFYEIR